MENTEKVLPIILVFLFQSVVLIIFNYINYMDRIGSNIIRTGFITKITLLVNLVIGITTILALIMIKKVFDMSLKELEYEKEIENLKHIRDLYNLIKIQRHDFNNHLQTIFFLLETNEIDEAKAYLRQSFKDIKLTGQIMRLKKPAVSALLQSKYDMARQKNVDLKFNIMSDLQHIPMKEWEINSVLGNLIYNAIEESINLPPELRKVEVELSENEHHFIFKITNSGNPIPEDLKEKLFLPGFTTKKEGQGIGLYSVKKIIKRYQGEIDYFNEDKKVCFCAKIPGSQ